MIKKLSAWSGAIAVRITTEVKELGWEVGDDIEVSIKNDEVVIKKVKEDKNDI